MATRNATKATKSTKAATPPKPQSRRPICRRSARGKVHGRDKLFEALNDEFEDLHTEDEAEENEGAGDEDFVYRSGSDSDSA